MSNLGSALDAAQVLSFRRKLMLWYRASARDLPWRGTANPYHTWVSEVMLQQTRVAAVLEHYDTFLRRFPTVLALALASEADVLAAWSGLGYYRRARSLHQAAKFLVEERAGQIPATAAELRTLPGIGEYTCAAIASIAFGESAAVLDGNVDRVLLRVTGRAEDASAEARTFIRRQADALVPNKRVSATTNAAGDHNQAMMELGATICLPRDPLCLQCPVYDLCRTRGEHLGVPRRKQRSQSIAYLLATRKNGARTEVLLTQRAAEASLMQGMFELPALPLDGFEEGAAPEPILRLRHSITDTNYYVAIYAQSGDAQGQTFTPTDDLDEQPERSESQQEDIADFSAAQADEMSSGLLKLVPAALATLSWHRLARLGSVPLTGLARKVLMRADLFSVAGPQTPLRSARAIQGHRGS